MTETISFESESEKELVIEVLAGANEEYADRGIRWVNGFLLGDDGYDELELGYQENRGVAMGDVSCACLSGSILMGANRKVLGRGMLDEVILWDSLDDCYGYGYASLHQATDKALSVLAWVINNDCPIGIWWNKQEFLVNHGEYGEDGSKMQISVVAFNDNVLDDGVKEPTNRNIALLVIRAAIDHAESIRSEK